jgi:hypothetical protein
MGHFIMTPTTSSSKLNISHVVTISLVAVLMFAVTGFAATTSTENTNAGQGANITEGYTQAK